jgi:hypothetical protein
MPVALLLAAWSTARKLPWQAWAAIIVIVAIAIGALWLRHDAYRDGISAEQARIARPNAEAREKADRGSLDVDQCYAGGGEWNREIGRCD